MLNHIGYPGYLSKTPKGVEVLATVIDKKVTYSTLSAEFSGTVHIKADTMEKIDEAMEVVAKAVDEVYRERLEEEERTGNNFVWRRSWSEEVRQKCQNLLPEGVKL